MTSAASCLQLTAVSLFNLRRDFPGGSDGKASAYKVGETFVQSLGWKDLLEKEMTTQSSILVWEIPWTGEPDSLQFVGSQKSQT